MVFGLKEEAVRAAMKDENSAISKLFEAMSTWDKLEGLRSVAMEKIPEADPKNIMARMLEKLDDADAVGSLGGIDNAKVEALTKKIQSENDSTVNIFISGWQSRKSEYTDYPKQLQAIGALTEDEMKAYSSAKEGTPAYKAEFEKRLHKHHETILEVLGSVTLLSEPPRNYTIEEAINWELNSGKAYLADYNKRNSSHEKQHGDTTLKNAVIKDAATLSKWVESESIEHPGNKVFVSDNDPNLDVDRKKLVDETKYNRSQAIEKHAGELALYVFSNDGHLEVKDGKLTAVNKDGTPRELDEKTQHLLNDISTGKNSESLAMGHNKSTDILDLSQTFSSKGRYESDKPSVALSEKMAGAVEQFHKETNNGVALNSEHNVVPNKQRDNGVGTGLA